MTTKLPTQQSQGFLVDGNWRVGFMRCVHNPCTKIPSNDWATVNQLRRVKSFCQVLVESRSVGVCLRGYEAFLFSCSAFFLDLIYFCTCLFPSTSSQFRPVHVHGRAFHHGKEKVRPLALPPNFVCFSCAQDVFIESRIFSEVDNVDAKVNKSFLLCLIVWRRALVPFYHAPLSRPSELRQQQRHPIYVKVAYK